MLNTSTENKVAKVLTVCKVMSVGGRLTLHDILQSRHNYFGGSDLIGCHATLRWWTLINTLLE